MGTKRGHKQRGHIKQDKAASISVTLSDCSQEATRNKEEDKEKKQRVLTSLGKICPSCKSNLLGFGFVCAGKKKKKTEKLQNGKFGET